MKGLAQLEAAANEATAAFRNALFEHFPAGSTVRVMLSAVQKNPSRGTVVGCWGDGRLGVRLETRNRRGDHTVKHVHWKNIISKEAA